MHPHIAVVGAVAVDVKACSNGPLVRHADVPGRASVAFGGVAHNVAKNLALMGVQVSCYTAVGDDPFGRWLRDDLSGAGVQVDRWLVLDEPTAMWVGVLDPAGDLDVGVFGGGILAAITPQVVAGWQEIAHSDFICVDATLSRPAIDELRSIAHQHGIPAYLNPASVARASTVADCVGRFDLVTANRLEAQVLTGRSILGIEDAVAAARALVQRGVRRAIVTLGADGLAYADSDVSRCEAAHPARVVDTTGAGDALAAMFCKCHLLGTSLDDTLQAALDAAARTVECGESVCEQIGDLPV